MPSLAPRLDTLESTHTFSGQASFAAGSAAAPSLRFTVDPTTGLYRIGVSAIGFTCAGVSAGQISSGAWTLGTTQTNTLDHIIYGKTITQGSNSSLGVRSHYDSTSTNGRKWTVGSNYVLGNGEFSIFNSSDSVHAATCTISGAWTLGSLTATNAKHAMKCITADYGLDLQNAHATDPYGYTVNFTAAAPNGVTNYFLQCNDNVAARFTARSNGGLANFSANNVNLSDERTKKDIQPAKDYLAIMCAIPVVTFKYKDQSHDDTNLGVIAQQVEVVAPEFVDVDSWEDKANPGQYMKAIYDTDIMFGMLKAIQELSAKNDALEARIYAIEN